TLSILTEALPVSGIGSFGTFEAGWTLGFVLIGYNQELSLLTGFGVNIIFFIFTIFLLIISFFLSKYREIITRKFLKLVKGNS
ncbi:unnamed protein product, partial [marine sediment metagenome]